MERSEIKLIHGDCMPALAGMRDNEFDLAIAAWDLCYDCTIYEIDRDYYTAAVERFTRHKSQGQLF